MDTSDSVVASFRPVIFVLDDVAVMKYDVPLSGEISSTSGKGFLYQIIAVRYFLEQSERLALRSCNDMFYRFLIASPNFLLLFPNFLSSIVYRF